MLRLCTTLICLFHLVLAKSGTLPDNFPRCKLDDDNYDSCIGKAIETAFVELQSGLPSLGVQPLDPLEISEINIEQGSGSVVIKLTLSNVLIHGFGGMKITSAMNELRTGGVNMAADTEVAYLQLISDYKIKGRVLILPISGEGKSNVTLQNIKMETSLENEKITQDGEEFIRVNKFNLKLKPKNVFFQFDNLFGGDETLGREMNKFLNENSLDIFQELSGAIEETFSEVAKQIANQLFLKVPYKTIFID